MKAWMNSSRREIRETVVRNDCLRARQAEGSRTVRRVFATRRAAGRDSHVTSPATISLRRQHVLPVTNIVVTQFAASVKQLSDEDVNAVTLKSVK